MRLRTALDNKLMDLRLRDKLLAEGKITEEQMAEHLANLPDETDNCTFFDPKKKEKKNISSDTPSEQ